MAARRKKAETVVDPAVKEVEPAEAVEAEEKPETIKAKVVAPYIDKYTDERHNAGEVIEVTKERFDEVNSKNKHLKKY